MSMQLKHAGIKQRILPVRGVEKEVTKEKQKIYMVMCRSVKRLHTVSTVRGHTKLDIKTVRSTRSGG